MAGEEKQTNVIGGYVFEDEQAAAQAAKELEGIKYIKSKMSRDKPEMVLQMYRKIINEKLFETPVGYGYLKELQEYLITLPGIRSEDVSPIPIARQKPAGQKEMKTEAHEEKHPEKPEKKVEVVERNINYKARYKGLVIVAVSLAVIVAAMFAITLTSNNPTILNYENVLMNKYQTWETKLNEREQAIRDWEKALQQPKNTVNTESGTEIE